MNLNSLHQTVITCALLCLTTGCDAEPRPGGAAAAKSEQPLAITCPPPAPPAGGPCLRVICDDGEWMDVAKADGTECNGGTGVCRSGSCHVLITTPSISNLAMASPSQVGFDQVCGTGDGLTTTVTTVKINGGAPVTLPDACAFFGSGHRFDGLNVRGGQTRCYDSTASNSHGTRVGTQRCFNTPEDLTPPAAPASVSVSPRVRSASVIFTDASNNETQFRCYVRRANTGAAWNLTNVFERFDSDHATGYPHTGTGESLECGPGLDTLQLDVDYEVKVEAYHDRAERVSSVVTPPFRSLYPIPAQPTVAGFSYIGDTEYTIARWQPTTFALGYKVYQQLNGGTWSVVASTTDLEATVTGLTPATPFCIDVVASNATGESDPGFGHPNKRCATTQSLPPTQRTLEVMLKPRVNIWTGQYFHGVRFWSNGRLDSLEFRSEDNGTLVGLIGSQPIASKGGADLTVAAVASDCALSAQGAVFLDSDGVLRGNQLTAIYGKPRPELLSFLRVGFCPVYPTRQISLDDLKMVVHYTGY